MPSETAADRAGFRRLIAYSAVTGALAVMASLGGVPAPSLAQTISTTLGGTPVDGAAGAASNGGDAVTVLDGTVAPVLPDPLGDITGGAGAAGDIDFPDGFQGGRGIVITNSAAASIVNATDVTISGGSGGKGSDSVPWDDPVLLVGRGGQGGHAIELSASPGVSIDNAGIIAGGQGGSGGESFVWMPPGEPLPAATRPDGGSAGNGVLIGNSSDVSLKNTGIIRGGGGGWGGSQDYTSYFPDWLEPYELTLTGPDSGQGGHGGIGVQLAGSANATIENSGRIRGGSGGAGGYSYSHVDGIGWIGWNNNRGTYTLNLATGISGDGGAGGSGILVGADSTAARITNNVDARVIGGRGGAGLSNHAEGSANISTVSAVGGSNGGKGGNAIEVADSANASIENSGMIRGGRGGRGGSVHSYSETVYSVDSDSPDAYSDVYNPDVATGDAVSTTGTGGSGGRGGDGIAAASAAGIIINNNAAATISGGRGGRGGISGRGGSAGDIDSGSATRTYTDDSAISTGGEGGNGGAGGSGIGLIASTGAVVGNSGNILGGRGGAGEASISRSMAFGLSRELPGSRSTSGIGGTGGAGGSAIFVGAGSDSATITNNAGAAITGGAGGTGGSSDSFAGILTRLPGGQLSSTSGTGGRGGHGGHGLEVLAGATIDNSGTISGGAGGSGGSSRSVGRYGLLVADVTDPQLVVFGAIAIDSSTSQTGNGGAGGAGGHGMMLAGASGISLVNNAGAVALGGAGGAGGTGGYNEASPAATGGNGGVGGSGGAGIFLDGTSGLTFSNAGQATGGAGGAAGAGGDAFADSMASVAPGTPGSAGQAGIGGAGMMFVAASGITLDNTGELRGGDGGAGGIGGVGGNNKIGLDDNKMLIGFAEATVGGAGSTGGTGGAGLALDAGSNVTVTSTAAITGGAGGVGGSGGGSSQSLLDSTASYRPLATMSQTGGNGGAGGAGGAGVQLAGMSTLNLTNSSTIQGGAGGAAGTGGTPTTEFGDVTVTGAVVAGAPGLVAGNGGQGVAVLDGAKLTMMNDAAGIISGGAGGAALAGSGGAGGNGGEAIYVGAGSVASITHAGTMNAGAGGAGDGGGAAGASANAVTFDSAGNQLTLWSTGQINGAVIAAQPGNTLALGGATDGLFDVSKLGNLGSAVQYQGFTQYVKQDASTWILNGRTAHTAPWDVREGILKVGDQAHPDTFIGGNVTVQAPATLRGHGTIGGSVFNYGTVHPGGSIGTLTVQGDYIGHPGSRMLANAIWNDPNSITTDKLVVQGNASGGTTVSVPGGIIGDVTVGGNQVKIADKPTIVVMGSDTGSNNGLTFAGTADTLNAGQAQLVKVADSYYWSLGSVISGPAPQPGPAIYAPGVPGYVQMARANREMGFAQLGKLHERVGEQQTWAWDDCGTRCAQYRDLTAAGKKPYPIWGRIGASTLKEQGRERLGYKSDTAFIQFGADLNVKTDAARNHQHMGVMASYSRGEHDFYDKYRAVNGIVSPDKKMGKGSTDMFSLGAYSTWYSTNGTYVDLVGNASFIRNKYKSASGSPSQNGYGLGASVEVGRPWQLGESRWMIEPQAQLSYQYVHLSDFDDDVRNIDKQNGGTLRGRLGARLAYNADNGRQRTNTFYVTANVLHDITGNKSRATIGRDSITENYGRTWAEVGVGAQFPLGKATYVFGDVKYERSLSNNSNDVFRGNDRAREGYSGRIGLRYTW